MQDRSRNRQLLGATAVAVGAAQPAAWPSVGAAATTAATEPALATADRAAAVSTAAADAPAAAITASTVRVGGGLDRGGRMLAAPWHR